MATKSELIARLEGVLQQPDTERSAEAVDVIKEAYEALVAAEHEALRAETAMRQTEEPAEEGATGGPHPPPAASPQLPQPMESAALTDEEDKKFKQLLDTFNTQVNDIRRKRQKEEAENLQQKQAIMQELRELIANEENIGNAFHRFNELGEHWRTIGPIPQQHFRELQHDYSQLREEFFYHIRIYKELRDHDLRKNTALKQALVADMEAVQRVDSVREAEELVKAYQDKWHQIGPVAKEEREVVRDAFWNATRIVYDRINDHYKARRAEQETNLEAKQALVAKVAELVRQLEQEEPRDWKQPTDQVLEWQQAWKSIGFATKKDNERVWKEFRAACNAFFDRKNVHYAALKDRFKAVKLRKEALIAQALELKSSTEWKRTADKLKELQQQWKLAGSAGQRDEHRLWGKFREACDAFFQARKETFSKQDEEQIGHLKEREDLIARLEGWTPSGDRTTDIQALKAFSGHWLQGGRISPRDHERLGKRYRTALDKHYGDLRMDADERRRAAFQDHLGDLASAPDGKERMEREARMVKRKIEELESELRQAEENMGKFSFKSAAGEAMRKEMERSQEKTREEIQRLQAQHKELRKGMRTPQAAPVEGTTDPDA
jgi:predicted XRE-type DNA-binding protein